MTCTDHGESAADIDAAIIVAGGASRRLGLDKPEQVVGGMRLLDVALDAVDGARVVVVGPPRQVPDGVLVVREEPAGGGPLAALAAGVAALPADARTVAVLAADLPELDRGTVGRLAALRARTGAPVALGEDHDGRAQYLLAVWDAAALRKALAGVADTAGLRLRTVIPADAPRLRTHVSDVDTPDDLRRALSSPGVARRLLRHVLAPLPVAEGQLADGAALAEPLAAAAPFPPFDQSAMDGWAVAGAPPWTAVDGAALAGHAAPRVEPGSAVRIATGARLPDGAERVIRDEEIVFDGASLTCVDLGRDDVRRAGSAWRAGELLARAGTVVDPALASLATAAGVHRAAIRGPIRITLHTSGDEVGAPGVSGLPETASGPVSALLSGLGARVVRGAHLPDDAETFLAALRAPGVDVVAIIGATGRGAADRLRGALEDAGAELLVDGVDVRPGGSILVATIPGGPVVLGLGGNPMAALLGAALLGPPLCAALLGARPRTVELLEIAGGNPDARWRMVPTSPDGAGRWHVPRSVATPHLRDAVGGRAIALLPPLAQPGDLVERLV